MNEESGGLMRYAATTIDWRHPDAWRLLRPRCVSCDEGNPPDECPKSVRKCGHHCNHSWSHDACCWCGACFEDAA